MFLSVPEPEIVRLPTESVGTPPGPLFTNLNVLSVAAPNPIKKSPVAS